MLTLIELHDLFDRLGTPLTGRQLVETARRLAPVRQVQSNSSNVITRYASRKMGRLVDCESRTVEFPAVIQYEHDPEVLEYYAQPVKIEYFPEDAQGKRSTRAAHTPDFLLVCRNGLILDEWRQEDRLARLSTEHPGRYLKEGEIWRFPVMEALLSERGIEYRMRSSREHPQVFIQNLTFLSDYLNPASQPVGDHEMEMIRVLFDQEPAILLQDLVLRGQPADPPPDGGGGEPVVPGYSADDVFKAIADGNIAFDLREDLLAEAHRAWVYRNLSTMRFAKSIRQDPAVEEATLSRVASVEEGAEIEYEGKAFKVILVGKRTAILQGERAVELELDLLARLFSEGKASILVRPDQRPATMAALRLLAPKAIDQALERAQWLDTAKVDPSAVPRSKRSLERYRQAIRLAGESPVDRHLALVSREAQRGNRERKVVQPVLDLISTVAREQFNTPRNITKTAAYAYFVAACSGAGQTPCSMRTFNLELEKLRSVRAQQGKRMAYQTASIKWYLQLQEPIHGARPFQFVHIDHTQLDILLVSGETGKSLGKPWLSLAVDAESREVVGFYLSFDAPSYRSCMMILRDIVRRHGRMPEMLVLDNGKEFHSVAITRLCLLYGCSLRYRPSGQPRFGSIMERLFGTTNTELIHLLEGNTKLLKNPRSLTKSVLPANFACWTLPMLHGALDYYFFKIYGVNPHPAHGDAPSEHFQRRLLETGGRWNRLVRYDQAFCIETCPSPKDSATRKVDGQRGVKISYLWYWNRILVRPDLRKKEVEVRVDPWDPGIAYVLIGNEWHQCISKVQPMLARYTEVERRYAMEEIAKKHGGRLQHLAPERIAEWLHAFDPKHFDPKLAEQQGELRTLYADLDMTGTMRMAGPVDPPEAGEPTPGARRGRPAIGVRQVTPNQPELVEGNDDQRRQPSVTPVATPGQDPLEDLENDYSLF